MYLVKLIEAPKINDFRHGFFPRKFALKRDAKELVMEVERKGGKAEIEKVARKIK